MIAALVALALAHPCHYHAGGALPDVRCTSGATNPLVIENTVGIARPGETRDTVTETICTPGWTATQRPTSSFTWRLKIVQMRRYGVAGRSTRLYQEDHLIPLELGGSPKDPRNLWPQPIRQARRKDVLENRLHRLVCAGKLSLFAARGLMAMDWRLAASLPAGTGSGG